jgi:acetyl esterase/lipase
VTDPPARWRGEAPTAPDWLELIPGRPSLRARLLDAYLRRVVKARSAQLADVTPAVIRASRNRLAALEPLVQRLAPAASFDQLDADGVTCERVVARGARERCALLLLHGGAYAVGSPRLYRNLAARLSAAADCAVLVPQYRLAPEHPFPAALDDARTAWDWLEARNPPALTAIAGDSAGGGLALATLLGLRDAARRMPAAAVALAPWTDLTCSGASLHANARADAYLEPHLLPAVARAYLGDADPRDPGASPLLGRHDGLPPLLLQVSSTEILLDDTLRMARSAAESGVAVRAERWPAMAHVFQLFAPFLPEASRALERIGRFLREAWD